MWYSGIKIHLLTHLCQQKQVKEGIDAVIVDNVLAIRRGLTTDQGKDEDEGEVKVIRGVEPGTEDRAQNQNQNQDKAQVRVVNGKQADNVAVSA